MADRSGADTLAVSCPFELSRFEDAAKVVGLENKLKVRDILELLAESMDLGDKGDVMKIAVIVRQVPDLIEPLEIAGSGQAVALDGATLPGQRIRQSCAGAGVVAEGEALGQQRHARSASGFGEIDDTLYAAAAKGADRIVTIAYDEPQPPTARQAAAMYAQCVKQLEADLVLVGVSAHDELESSLAPLAGPEPRSALRRRDPRRAAGRRRPQRAGAEGISRGRDGPDGREAAGGAGHPRRRRRRRVTCRSAASARP